MKSSLGYIGYIVDNGKVTYVSSVPDSVGTRNVAATIPCFRKIAFVHGRDESSNEE